MQTNGYDYTDTIDAEIVGMEPSLQPTAMIPIAQATGSGSALSAFAPMITAAAGVDRTAKVKIDRAKWIGSLLGKSGFYEFPVGGKTISGPSIDLAQALAQEWGAMAYQVEIVSDESLASGGKRVHLRATVIDLKAVVMAAVDQVVATAPPSKGFAAKADQAERWHAMQLQNAASKIVRNAILRVLPAWYVDAAFDSAVSTASAKALNGRPLAEVRANTVKAFADLGISVDELAAYVGLAVDLWAVPQIDTARDLYRDLKQGRVTVEAVRAASPSESAPANGSSALGARREPTGQPVTAPAPPAPAPEPAKPKKAATPPSDDAP